MNSEKINNFHIPVNPKLEYKNEWKGWDDLFGIEPKWTNEKILEFLYNIQDALEMLDPIELYTIIEQSGAINLSKNKTLTQILQFGAHTPERKNMVKALISEFEIKSNRSNTQDNISITHNNIIGDNVDSSKMFSINNSESFNKLYINDLKAFDNKYLTSSIDEESLNFLLQYRINKICNDFLAFNIKNIEGLEKEKGGKHFTYIKEQFLKENKIVKEMPISKDYNFCDESGNILEPNMMQKLTAYKLFTKKKFGNWSGQGAGKTLSAIFAGRFIKAKNTLIITINSTIDNWEDTILKSFPSNSTVFTKESKKIKFVNIDGNHNYIILNYETFQQENSEKFIKDIILKEKVDYVILDEAQCVKQREEYKSSHRRNNISKLMAHLEHTNFELYVLMMSATPVVNNLYEPKKILELMRGVFYNDIKTYHNINNAINIYRQLCINGIRHIPKYKIGKNILEIEINGSHLYEEYKRISKAEILQMEKLLLNDKLINIKKFLKPGAIIYTHYVSGIIDNIKKHIENEGFTCGFYTGEDKSGLKSFLQKETDILIASSAIGVGFDGLQKVSDTIIIMSLPWTNSEYENLVGRIYREGSVFDSINIIIPQIIVENESRDKERWNNIRSKKTLSDVVIDGIIPDMLLPENKELIKTSKNSLKKWIGRIQNNELIKVDRPQITYLFNQNISSIVEVVIPTLEEKGQIGNTSKSEIEIPKEKLQRPGKEIIIDGEKFGNPNIHFRLGTVENKKRPNTVYIIIMFWVDIKNKDIIIGYEENEESNFKKAISKKYAIELNNIYSNCLSPILKDSLIFPLYEENIFIYDFPEIINYKESRCFTSIELTLHTINCIDKNMCLSLIEKEDNKLFSEMLKISKALSKTPLLSGELDFSIHKSRKDNEKIIFND